MLHVVVNTIAFWYMLVKWTTNTTLIITTQLYSQCISFPFSIHHYSMEMQHDGKVMIENGKRFPGPVELLDYHRTHRDGLLTYPNVPCTRSPNESYVVFRGVSSADLDQILLKKAQELGVKVCY